MTVQYRIPQHWISFDFQKVQELLVEAKASIQSLRTVPYQKSWAKSLQEIELKREIAGTSKIEGADFTDNELNEALKESPEELLTRSQRQAHAAVRTYKWIASISDDIPINDALIFNIHSKLVVGADDDHCAPGKLRTKDQNVTFGIPRHRGAEGGNECKTAFSSLINAINSTFKNHDPLIQAFAAHYHFAAIHPFLDGNGRTARALEALFLQRIGLRDTVFISMSNYYYDEKNKYLSTMSDVRQNSYDLTSFIQFGLKGVISQTKRLLTEIQKHIQKGLYRNLMYDLFNRLMSTRKRVIAERQVEILNILLEHESYNMWKLYKLVEKNYINLKNSQNAYIRDLIGLMNLQCVKLSKEEDSVIVNIVLEWPSNITESEFFEMVKQLPKAKTHPFLT